MKTRLLYVELKTGLRGAECLPAARYEVVGFAVDDARASLHDRLNRPSAA